MAKLNYKNGVTSVILRVKIMDSTSTTGGAKTGLAFNTAGLIISTIADNEATATAYTQAGSTIETITTLGTFAAPTATKCRFKEVDATNHPGLYEIQIADARWGVSNARSVIVTALGATGAAQVDAEIQVEPVPANLTHILGTILTETSGQIAAAFKKFFDKASPTGTVNSIPDAVAGAASGLAIVGSSMALGADAVNSTSLAASASAEIADAVWDEPAVEPTGVPAVNGAFRRLLEWMFIMHRNKRTQTATTELVRNDADSATLGTSTKSDDGTTFTRGKYS